MRTTKLIWAATALSLAGAVMAGEDAKHKVMVEVITDDGGDGIHLTLDSDDAGFNLHGMQVGENRSFVDKSGRSVLVTREEDGFSFDVDGKTVKMPDFDGAHHGAIVVDGGATSDVDVHVSDTASFVGDAFTDGVVIISGKPIDESTRQSIRSVLQSAGHSGDVDFVDRESSPHGQPHVRVIRKEIEVTE